MLYLITDLLGQLTINDNGKNLLFNALQKNVLDYNEFMELIYAVAAKQNDETIVNRLADILANVLFEKKTLTFIEHKLANDQCCIHFLKKCLSKIGK
jgi:hypothetical protein